MLEGVAFSLLFTTGVVVVGRLLAVVAVLDRELGRADGRASALGPILGAGIGGFVYQHLGPASLYAGASALALSGAVVAWFALKIPELDRPLRGRRGSTCRRVDRARRAAGVRR